MNLIMSFLEELYKNVDEDKIKDFSYRVYEDNKNDNRTYTSSSVRISSDNGSDSGVGNSSYESGGAAGTGSAVTVNGKGAEGDRARGGEVLGTEMETKTNITSVDAGTGAGIDTHYHIHNSSSTCIGAGGFRGGEDSGTEEQSGVQWDLAGEAGEEAEWDSEW